MPFVSSGVLFQGLEVLLILVKEKKKKEKLSWFKVLLILVKEKKKKEKLSWFKFLDEEGLSETAHKLEQESGCYFNMDYFESQVLAGEWDKVECYLSGFTTVRENLHSTKIFFEIRKQKYLEALDMEDYAKAVEILRKDLKVFEHVSNGIYKELLQLMPLRNIRQNEKLSDYGDRTSTRKSMFLELRKLLKGNPQICNKLKFPHTETSRLRTLINQSLNWQHQLCKDPTSKPDIKTLFVDHICVSHGGSQSHTNNSIDGVIPQGVPSFPIPTHAPFLHGVDLSGSSRLSLTGWMANSEPSMPHPPAGIGNLFPPQNAGLLKQNRTPTANSTGTDYQFLSPVHVAKRSRIGPSDVMMYRGPTQPHNIYPRDDLPMKVVRSFSEGSKVISMDFHPQKHSILLVGTNTGDLGIWDVGSYEKLVHKTFGVWDALNGTTKSVLFVEKQAVSVNRCIWSPNGEMVGVAFSECIIRIYSYTGYRELRPHLEINAHIGGVNDIAFNCHKQQLSVITCGDDKCIKVWDAVTGCMRHTFEGHEAPVYCVFPHQKENVQFILSTAIDGKIKAWFYDGRESTFDYDVPGKFCTAIAYSDDGSRLFSCGTSKEGESYLVEWNESDGKIKRTYCGLQKNSFGVVQFDTTRNRFLVVGDDNQLKFWDMDNVTILATTYVEEGCLETSPRLCFNKEGSLLAVTTKNSGIKILANANGLQLLHTLNNEVFHGAKIPIPALVTKDTIINSVASVNETTPLSGTTGCLEKILSVASVNNADSNRPTNVNQSVRDEDANKIKRLNLAEVSRSIHCRSLKLPDGMSKGKIVQLVYTKSGSNVLALDSNASHKRWIWTCNEGNPTGKVTTTIPTGFESATHGSSHKDPGKQISCMVLSNNDRYILSCSGGEVSLLTLEKLKSISILLPPSPPATSFALHPEDNNVVAFGLENLKILICNLKSGSDKMLQGHHQKKITSLAFSLSLDLLISAGADGLLCAWSLDGYGIQREQIVYPHGERLSSPVGVSKIQFHKDQVHLLVVQENQIAIYYSSAFEQACYWKPQDSMSAPISSAQYSCDSQLVYASFCDGAVGVFDADILRPLFRVPPAAFLPSGMSSDNVYPLAIAAHPHECNQFAIGLTDGGVYLIDLIESQGKEAMGSLENGVVGSDPSTSNHGSELPS
ncbi:protein TOPLESS-RELATED PROTEIN 2 isoform X3 [Cryptomeria japonica]|uniref:protein TOPLESS-RELATED PROTEIN 2 isoform X3 n=1 Tax=Cryptomeria japonica TaxID=3369 RepID=UPI0027DA3BB2|nr:protein TOPLESS-RELATED PROTEIN 2 isoform X3 [Cryptomeria japonica]